MCLLNYRLFSNSGQGNKWVGFFLTPYPNLSSNNIKAKATLDVALPGGKNYCMVAQPPVTCRFVHLDNDLSCLLIMRLIVRHNMAKGQVSGVKLKLLRFFLALFKNKIIFRSVPKCQYLTLIPGFFPSEKGTQVRLPTRRSKES
jgi:hypothetical protein